ncbi:MAG: efflux transporter periplasmic adaptor subunit, partial [Geobacteraceae bacterium]|nr:efflux transporter periplasmic adaptor subunit [Geobacteraceae bacterium]
MHGISGIRLSIALGCLVVSLSASGCGKKPATASPKGGPPEVGVIVVQPQRVTLTTELPGRTSAHLVAEVRPQVG